MKAAIHKNLEEEQELSPEKLADQLFDNNLTARLTLLMKLKSILFASAGYADFSQTKIEESKLSRQR